MKSAWDLKPCPFCGGEAEYESERVSCWIECSKCGAKSGYAFVAYPQEAVEAWNERVASTTEQS